jgi:uncharacterized protein
MPVGFHYKWRLIVTSISTSLLKQIIADQQNEHVIPSDYHQRSIEKKLNQLTKNNEIIVLTGIRRCGKSVLLHRFRAKSKDKDYYFNFEDERLVTFTSDNFQLLYEVFIEVFGEQKTFYFDEIQNIPGWEMFIRRLYNAGNKIYITGSNATLFSEELGTRLTGRYIQVKIYPFSFAEYAQYEFPKLTRKKLLSTHDIGKIRNLFNTFCKDGGIPEYVRNHQTEYLHALYESIIYRDIVARYKVTNTEALKKLVYYLASNCSKKMTYNSLRKLLGLGSPTTVSDYCGYLENSYLCYFLSRYSPSLKAQQQSPKKVYYTDHALAKIVGFRFSDDIGRVLENIIFLELKRRGKNLYYHRENKECDFIIQHGTKIQDAIQVTYSLSDQNTRQREFDGLIEALEKYTLKSGLILTDSEEGEETIHVKNTTYRIRILPVWKWLLDITI